MLKNIILVLAVVGCVRAQGYGNTIKINRPTETHFVTEQGASGYGDNMMTNIPKQTEVVIQQGASGYGNSRPMGGNEGKTNEIKTEASGYGAQGYGNSRPMGTQMGFNPCTEEVMRAAEIQLFPNANDQTQYLICTDVNTPISMPCSPGTVFDQNLRHCIPVGWEAPRCPVGTCFNNADCVIDELNQASCLCRVGFTGDRCEVNIDECALGGNQVCGESSGTCIDQINAFYCEWNNGAEIGLRTRINRPCSLTDLESNKQFFALESPEGNVFLQCTGEFSFLVTKCADMLFWHQELRTCSIERPLEKTGVCKQYPCRNDGTCVDLGGNSFRCDCKEGYMGDVCEEPIDFCLNKPCQMGGRCVSHPGGFNCVCQDLIVDQSCATGVQNPCKGAIASEYFPNNVDATKYVSCSLGYGFVKSCAPGLKWSQEMLNCMLIEELMAPTHATKISSYGTPSSYGSSYGSSYETVTIQTPPTRIETPKYQAPPMNTPKYQSPPMETPKYQSPPTHIETPKYQAYTAPPTRTFVETPKYETVTPRFTPPPVAQYEAPRMVVTPVKPAYGQLRPMSPTPVQQSSYGQMGPQSPTPVAKPYGQNFGSRMLSYFKQ